MLRSISNFKIFIFADERGVTGIEYGLVLAAIALSVGVLVFSAGEKLGSLYDGLVGGINPCKQTHLATSFTSKKPPGSIVRKVDESNKCR
jgi:Flp pilus assembly pilin Flp